MAKTCNFAICFCKKFAREIKNILVFICFSSQILVTGQEIIPESWLAFSVHLFMVFVAYLGLCERIGYK